MMTTTDKMIRLFGLPIIAIAGILVIILLVLNAKTISTENNAYLRVINCVVSHNPSVRTQSDIDTCYVKVEKQLNIHLQRYNGANSQ